MGMYPKLYYRETEVEIFQIYFKLYSINFLNGENAISSKKLDLKKKQQNNPTKIANPQRWAVSSVKSTSRGWDFSKACKALVILNT